MQTPNSNMKKAPQAKIPRHGWLVMDKPLGLTSTQTLGRARRLLGGTKVGHGGTLDPLATGILPLAFGEATKLIPYIMDGEKEYEFTIKWGEGRDTEDAEGKVIETSDVRPTVEQIKAALPRFVGLLSQIPPAYSALKLDGERAYDIARAGGTPLLAPRLVEVHSLTLTGSTSCDDAPQLAQDIQTQQAEQIYTPHPISPVQGPNPYTATASFRTACGKGMYVRAIARDLAHALGTCGHIVALRRTRVGPFSLRNAVTLEMMEQAEKDGRITDCLLPIRNGLGNIPILNLMPNEAEVLHRGQGMLIRPQHMPLMDSELVFAEHQGLPVALVAPMAGEFRVVRGFSFGN